MSILGERIKKERENLGLSREELANKIGVSYSAIAMYERGEREPNNALILKMRELFKCSMDYLMGNSDFRTKKEEINSFLDTQDFIDLNNAIKYYSSYFDKLKFNSDNIEEFKNAIKLNRNLSVEANCDKLENYINKFPSVQRKQIRNLSNMILGELSYLEKYKKVYCKIFAKELQSNTTSSQYYLCPVYGQISAGQPNWAEECIDGYLPIDPNLMNIVNPDECYFLRIHRKFDGQIN